MINQKAMLKQFDKDIAGIIQANINYYMDKEGDIVGIREETVNSAILALCKNIEVMSETAAELWEEYTQVRFIESAIAFLKSRIEVIESEECDDRV